MNNNAYVNPFEPSNREHHPRTGIIVFIAIILTAVITSGACMIASNNDANADTDGISVQTPLMIGRKPVKPRIMMMLYAVALLNHEVNQGDSIKVVRMVRIAPCGAL